MIQIGKEQLRQKLIEQLQLRFPQDDCRVDDESFDTYGQDWTRFYEVDALAIVFPRCDEDVQWLVMFAREHQIAIVPSGGRTGLSAAAVATKGEIVVSFEKMNQILEFNQEDSLLRCQSGVITEVLQQFAEQNDLYYPVDFASSGSSQIGGNVATNAGGIRVLRYGMTREQVIGLKVVTGEGKILELNQGLQKNATGYDFRHLMIGSEGTLGLITEVTVKLIQKPGPQSVLVLGVENLDALMPVLNAFQEKLTLSAFEFFSDQALTIVKNHQSLQQPFETKAPYYALLEVDMSNQNSEETLLECFDQAFEQGWILDGVMSSSDAQAESLWKLREGISESISAWTPYKNDISVRTSRVPEFLTALEEKLETAYSGFESIWFGHIGDGNLHLNILKPEPMNISEFKSICCEFSKIIYQQVADFDGSISAEHGVGMLKKDFLHYSRSTVEIEYQRAIKKIFDPDDILNPGKIF